MARPAPLVAPDRRPQTSPPPREVYVSNDPLMDAAAPAPAAAQVGPPTLFSGWPALLLALVVAAATVVSFTDRPVPPFPVTATRPDALLVTGLAQSGNRIVAVGENGRILIADSQNGPWHEAKVTPQRASTFTRVRFINADTAIAVGHDGWIVRSGDKGKTWKEVVFDPEKGDPLLGISGPYDGKLYAYGAFGLFLVSTDNGLTWAHEEHESIGDRHLAAMVQAADGSLVVVGESGLMARSADHDKTWVKLPEIYNGSFYGLQRLPDGALLAFGMRGNAFLSRDAGKHWTRSEVPGGLSLYDAVIDRDGAVILVGENSSVFRSTDGGHHFEQLAEGDRKRYASVLPLSNGDGWLIAGEGGVGVHKQSASPAAGDAR